MFFEAFFKFKRMTNSRFGIVTFFFFFLLLNITVGVPCVPLNSAVDSEKVQVWLAPLPIHSCVGAIANRGQWEQGCRLFMATDLGPVRTTRKKKHIVS